jgi:hypothetical protein
MEVVRKFRRAGHRVAERLRERGVYLRPNDRGLAALEGRHEGETAFVLGMGPSLKVADLELLRDRLTFCCNKIFLAFGETDFRPNYYSICDLLVGENNRDRILETDFGGAQPIHSDLLKPVLGEQSGALFYRYAWDLQQRLGDPVFPESLPDGLAGGGCSVLIDQIQLAWLMGCRDIVLLGVDFSFQISDRTGEKSASGEVLKSRGEVNHFHPDYRKPGETWTVPMMEEQRRGFDYCRRVVEGGGGRLVNASRSTKLDVLPREALETILEECDGRGR